MEPGLLRAQGSWTRVPQHAREPAVRAPRPRRLGVLGRGAAGPNTLESPAQSPATRSPADSSASGQRAGSPGPASAPPPRCLGLDRAAPARWRSPLERWKPTGSPLRCSPARGLARPGAEGSPTPRSTLAWARTRIGRLPERAATSDRRGSRSGAPSALPHALALHQRTPSRWRAPPAHSLTLARFPSALPHAGAPRRTGSRGHAPQRTASRWRAPGAPAHAVALPQRTASRCRAPPAHCLMLSRPQRGGPASRAPCARAGSAGRSWLGGRSLIRTSGLAASPTSPR
jgi:hypothetical protein